MLAIPSALRMQFEEHLRNRTITNYLLKSCIFVALDVLPKLQEANLIIPCTLFTHHPYSPSMKMGQSIGSLSHRVNYLRFH